MLYSAGRGRIICCLQGRERWNPSIFSSSCKGLLGCIYTILLSNLLKIFKAIIHLSSRHWRMHSTILREFRVTRLKEQCTFSLRFICHRRQLRLLKQLTKHLMHSMLSVSLNQLESLWSLDPGLAK